MMESSDWDGELDPSQCSARMWRGGFGGQGGKEAVDFNDVTRWSVCENGFKLGLCKNHSGQLTKKGKLTHGYFDEVPERHHAWRWKHDREAWTEIEEDKKNPH